MKFFLTSFLPTVQFANDDDNDQNDASPQSDPDIMVKCIVSQPNLLNPP